MKLCTRGLTDNDIDFDLELGKLEFLCQIGSGPEPSEEGEGSDVKKLRYDLRSHACRDIIRVGIPIEFPKVDLPRGTVVRLVNPVIRFINQRPPLNPTPYITAEGIVPVMATATAQPQQKPGQPQKDGKQQGQ